MKNNKLENLNIENKTVELKLRSNKRLYQYGALFVAIIMVFSSIGYATIKLGEDGSGQKWFGADPGLITNSNGKAWAATGANLQLAIDDLNHYGTVYLPAVNIDLTTTISASGGISFIGSGMYATEIWFNGSGVAFDISGDYVGNFMERGVFQNILLKNDTSVGYCTGIRVTNATYRIINCNIFAFSTNLLLRGSSYHCDVSNCDFGYCQDVNIWFDMYGLYQPNACVVENCDFNSGEDAYANIYVEEGGGGTISNCYFENGAAYNSDYHIVICDHSWRVINSKIGSGSDIASVLISPDVGGNIDCCVFDSVKISANSTNVANVYIDGANMTDENYVTFSKCIFYTAGIVGMNSNNNYLRLTIDSCHFEGTHAQKSLLTVYGEKAKVVNSYFYTPNLKYLIESYANNSNFEGNTFVDGSVGIKSGGHMCLLSGNNFYSQSDCSIKLEGEGSKVTSSFFDLAGTRAIAGGDIWKNVSLDGLYINNCNGGIYSYHGSQNLKITKCHLLNVADATCYGIFLDDNSQYNYNASITNCVISNSTTGGIRIDNGYNTTIMNNDISGTPISILCGGSDNLVLYNRGYNNNSLFPFYEQTTAPTIADNCTAYWYDTDNDYMYQITNSYGTVWYVNMTTTI